MSPPEQARYLTHAARAGLTGPDYARSLLCRTSAAADERLIDIRLRVSTRLHRRLLAASAARNSSLEEVLANALDDAPALPSGVASFEVIDALTRIGRDLSRIADVAAATGYVPDELDEALAHLERVLVRVLPP